MIFNLNDYPQSQAAMVCRTDDEVKVFQEFLHKNQRRWSSGHSYIEYNLSKIAHNIGAPSFSNGIVFWFNKGTWSSERTMLNHPFIALNFSDFEWINDELSIDENDKELLTSFLNQFGGISG